MAKMPLREFRMRNMFRQVEIAKLAGMSSSRLSKIEHGWQKPSLQEIERLRLAFLKLKVEPKYII